MQLRAHIFNLAALCITLLLVAAFPSTVRGAASAQTPAREASRTDPYHGDSRNGGHTFPFLRWLRDTTVEIVFGRPERTSGGRGRSRAGAKDGLARQYGGATHARYGDDVVIRFNVSTQEEEGALSEAADRLFLDVWAFTDEYVDVRLPRDDVASLMTLLPPEMQPSVLVPDVAAAVLATYPSGSRENARLGPDWFEPGMATTLTDGVDNIFFQDYQPLSVITSWLRLLEAMFPSYVSLISIGKSYEGRDIMAVRLGARVDSNAEPARRQTILITGGIHAREWVSTSTVNYLIWSFATTYGKGPLVTKLLQRFDFVFIPVLNPDGYEYTWEHDRLWRKSRQQTSMRFCRGLDLDRAFGYKWETAKHQRDPCSESYGGDEPFEAVEATTLAEWAKEETQHGVQFLGLLDLHSYSQQILFPYSYTCAVDPPNRENLEELAVGLAKAVRLSSGEFYAVRSACEGAVSGVYSGSGSVPRIEAGGGSAIDWFYHDINARYSYQIRLRDTGSYGFLLPPKNIVPTGEEILNAVKYFGDYLLGNNGIESVSDAEQSDIEDDSVWTELRRRRKR